MHLAECGHLWTDCCHDDFCHISDDFLSDSPKRAAAARRCNRRSPIQSPYRVLDKTSRSPRFNSEELCYCTEELGSESTSCIVDCTLIEPCSCWPPMQMQESGVVNVDNPAREKVNYIGLGQFDEGVSFSRVSHAAMGGQRHARIFPPPISSLLSDRPLMRSFKANGRFVLKRVDNASQSIFRATRMHGRLRLDLISPVEDPEAHSFPASPSFSTNPAEQEEFFQKIKAIEGSLAKERASNTLLNPPNTSLKWEFSMVTEGTSSVCRNFFSPTNKLQALVMCTSTGTPSSGDALGPMKGQLASNSKGRTGMKAGPHVFAVLNFFPFEVGVIILEFGQSKSGDLRLNGVYNKHWASIWWQKKGPNQALARVCGINEMPGENFFGCQGCKTQNHSLT